MIARVKLDLFVLKKLATTLLRYSAANKGDAFAIFQEDNDLQDMVSQVIGFQ